MRNLYMYYKRLKQYIDKREKTGESAKPKEQAVQPQEKKEATPSTP